MTNFPIIGISGSARAGKDTLCRILSRSLNRIGVPAKRFALADTIKSECEEKIQKRYGLSVYSDKTEEKAIFRPYLVDYGLQKRNETLGRYFVEKINNDVVRYAQVGVPILTDIRYIQYPHDEYYWLTKELGGFSIFLERYDITGTGEKISIPPANQHEAENNPLLKSVADYTIEWETQNSDDFDYPEVSRIATEIFFRHNLNQKLSTLWHPHKTQSTTSHSFNG